MMGYLDVAARLAEGQPALEHTQTYVDACRTLGYQHPDLTAHHSQVRDWYETETGLDLDVLDADCAALWAAVNTIEEALAIQRAQTAELAATWRGVGAASAAQFLQRHCDAAAAVATRVRAAAERCSALRDDLWQAVDGKVATTLAVDDRSLDRRSSWLAAAQTVISGIGDRATAEELVRQELIPYVDNNIRSDWLTAMRSAVDAVAASYATTIDALTTAPRVCFEIPGALGPQPPLAEASPTFVPTATMPPAAAVIPPASTIPAGISSPPEPVPAGLLDDSAPGPVPPVPDMAAPLGDFPGLSTATGDLGGLGGLAGTIGGVVGKIANGIGGLLGALADGLADSQGLDDPLMDDPPDLDGDPLDEELDQTDDEPAPETAEESDETPTTATDVVDDQAAVPEPADGSPPPAPEPLAEPAVAPAPVAPSPPETPEAQPATPCEIAADELPQAGE
nr:hypothetical protein [Mycobacterium shimoidei]